LTHKLLSKAYFAKLGGVCETDDDCQPGFAICDQNTGKCTCRNGFIADNNLCLPTSSIIFLCINCYHLFLSDFVGLYCPASTKSKSLVPLEGNMVKMCQVKKMNGSSSGSIIFDDMSCDSSEKFCFVHTAWQVISLFKF